MRDSPERRQGRPCITPSGRGTGRRPAQWRRGCGLLDNTESFSIQLAQDSGLSRARRAGQDEPFHPESLNLTAIGSFRNFRKRYANLS